MRRIIHSARLSPAAALGLALLACIMGCSEKGKDQKAGGAVVKGYVFQSDSKKPCPSAPVLVGLGKTKTNGSGTFEVSGVSPGKTLLTTYTKEHMYSAMIDVKSGTTVVPKIYLEKMAGAPPEKPKVEEKKGGEEKKAGEEKTVAVEGKEAAQAKEAEKGKPSEGGEETGEGKGSAPAEKDASGEGPEEVIKAYYKAINAQDYKKAAKYRAGLSGKKLAKIYEPYIKNVSVTKLKKAPDKEKTKVCYNVQLKASYIKHYTAGSGDLPTFHCLKKDKKGNWRISNITAGP